MKQKMNREKNGSETRPVNLDKILNFYKEKTADHQGKLPICERH